MKILIIGDSFVEGVGAKGKYGWAQKLKEYLKNHNVEISGVGGDNIKKINDRILDFNPNQFDLILLEIGLNDSRYRPSKQANEVSKEDFFEGLNIFTQYFKKSNKKIKIIIIGLTEVDENLACPSKEDKYYINGNIEKYNSYLKEYSSKNEIDFFDMPSLVDNDNLSDGLHPNDNGHEILFKTIKDKLQAL